MAQMGFSYLSNPAPHSITRHEVVNRLRFSCFTPADWHNPCVTAEWQSFHDGCRYPAQQCAPAVSNIDMIVADNNLRNFSTS